MDEQLKVALATVLGAVIGGVFGCLYLTEQGRRTREQIDPLLDEVIGEIHRLRSAAEKLREAAQESRRAVDDFMGEARPRPWGSGSIQ
jgi:gas vesicle protein